MLGPSDATVYVLGVVRMCVLCGTRGTGASHRDAWERARADYIPTYMTELHDKAASFNERPSVREHTVDGVVFLLCRSPGMLLSVLAARTAPPPSLRISNCSYKREVQSP